MTTKGKSILTIPKWFKVELDGKHKELAKEALVSYIIKYKL